YAIPSGKLLRTWTGPFVVAENGGIAANTVGLAWKPDGRTLVYSLPGAFTTGTPLRALDTRGPASGFTDGGRAVITFRVADACYSPVLTADGQTVLCGTPEGILWTSACDPPGMTIYSYAAATAKRKGVAYRYPGRCAKGAAAVVWTGPGQTAITLA